MGQMEKAPEAVIRSAPTANVFGGLGVKETAEVLKVSNETVMRDWKLAKVWLLRELSGGKRHAG
jgi:ECF sigma factor